MPRKPFVCDAASCYHLVARTNNQDWYGLPLADVWKIMEGYLFFIHHAFNVQICSFVLMSNHFHLIARFPEGNLSDAMEYFMGQSSRCIAHDCGRINHIYGTRIFRSRLQSLHYFMNAYKYVYRNPVQAGLSQKAEDYEYSTLSGKLGSNKLIIPVAEDTLLFENVERVLQWINTQVSSEDHLAVKQALKHSDFKLPKYKYSKKPNRLETALL